MPLYTKWVPLPPAHSCTSSWHPHLIRRTTIKCSPAATPLGLRRRIRLPWVSHAESSASYASYPLYRDFRRGEPLSGMGAKVRDRIWGLGIRKRYDERTHPTQLPYAPSILTSVNLSRVSWGDSLLQVTKIAACRNTDPLKGS